MGIGGSIVKAKTRTAKLIVSGDYSEVGFFMSESERSMTEEELHPVILERAKKWLEVYG